MNLAMRVAIAGMSAWAAASGMAQSAGPAQPAAVPAQPAVQAAMLQNLQVKEVNLAEIDTSHVKLAVDLNLTAAQSVTVDSFRLCSLHLNGMPVFAAPLNQEIVLKKGAPGPGQHADLLICPAGGVEVDFGPVCGDEDGAGGDPMRVLIGSLGAGRGEIAAACGLNEEEAGEIMEFVDELSAHEEFSGGSFINTGTIAYSKIAGIEKTAAGKFAIAYFCRICRGESTR